MLLGCIADDFTGAADLANNLVRTGMRVVQTIGVPVLPVRQWVLSIPKRLRYFLRRDPAALSAVLHILLRAIEARLREASHCPDGRLGAVRYRCTHGVSFEVIQRVLN